MDLKPQSDIINENFEYLDTYKADRSEIPDISDLATKEELEIKQDTIDDLDTIRANASTGAGLKTQVEINTSNISALETNKADKTELPTKLSDLEDDITDSLGAELDYTGTTLSLLNAQSDVLSSVTIKSTPDLDNVTISLNDKSELQSIGNVLTNGGVQNYWCGTKSEYDAIQEKDPNTLYEVIDEVTDLVTEIPTATVEDIGLVKPDGTTIVIDDTGTISAPNTSLLNHNSSNGAHTELFSAKANTNLNNVSANYDWVVATATYGGGESGYIKYRNNRVEQWGVATTSASGETEFTMHIPFRDMNFSVFIEPREMGDFFHYAIPSAKQKFKTRVKGSNGSVIAIKVQWRAFGYAE